MNFMKKFAVQPGSDVKLNSVDTEFTAELNKKQAQKLITENHKQLSQLEYVLYAQARHSILIILQAMDAGGKDGTIRHVMGPLNPQSCKVTSFKSPSENELAHDYLWRVHHRVPPKGHIGIFNRSHYEDVLFVRVHNLVPQKVWSGRFEHINNFEKMLSDENVTILKFFLHISKGEQLKRLKSRIDDPQKHWKIDPADFAERKNWSKYQNAYEDILTKCSTEYAPWIIVPADKKWFRNLVVSQILCEKLKSLKMKFPPPKIDPASIEIK